MRRIAALCWFGAAAAVPLYGAQIWARGARAFLCFFYFLCGRAAARPHTLVVNYPGADLEYLAQALDILTEVMGAE